ncbi:MAG: thioredoxin family protein [Planctomycetota bacterium]
MSISRRMFAMMTAGVVATGALLASSVQANQHKAMKAEIGQPAPIFELADTNGKTHKLSDFTEKGKIVVLEWWNPGCPFVVKHHERMTTMADTAKQFKGDNVVWIKINSTNSSHKDYGLDKKMMKKWKVDSPVLLDTDGTVGKMYGAKTTPHMYIVDAKGILRYNGAIDSHRGWDSYSESDDVTNYVEKALKEIIAGETVTMSETKPYGCSVKYAK